MDQAGRLVIPRAMRESVGLAEGGEVDVEFDGTAIRILPASRDDLIEEDGFLVIPSTGSKIGEADVRELIDAERHSRG